MISLDKTSRPPGPSCGSNNILKNGSIHNKKPKFICKSCRRNFIKNPTKKYINERDKEIIKNLLLERISLRGIAQSLDIYLSWLYDFISLYRSNDFNKSIIEVKAQNLIIECDELWSYVNNKENPVYIWLAYDRNTKQIVGCHLGERDSINAQMFWESLPEEYQQNAQAYTDFWAAYSTVIPSENHHPSKKNEGETNHIERFNNTLRTRCSRLVKKRLSFSKKFFNHISAIYYFINNYNQKILLINNSFTT
jgi:insertion element IS1 protein InsB